MENVRKSNKLIRIIVVLLSQFWILSENFYHEVFFHIIFNDIDTRVRGLKRI